jgi:uncharacterized protein (DUF1697 family)
MMPRFVAFLRGINVGGHVVKNEKLREAFTSLGFQNVTTYKQSGNVIFESSNTNAQELKKSIEDKLRLVLGFDAPVLLRTMEQLRSIIEDEPFKIQNQEGTSFLVTMLPSVRATFPLQFPLTIPKSTAVVISAKGSEVFSVTHGGGEGALPNPFIESKLKLKATTRNINIIREIVEKYDK